MSIHSAVELANNRLLGPVGSTSVK